MVMRNNYHVVMKKILVLTFGVLALMCSCSRQEMPGNNEPREVSFSISQNAYVFTKATEAALEDNDVIQIIAGNPINATSAATVSGSTLTLASKIFWNAGQTVPTNFVAIYPGAGQASTTIDNYDLVGGGSQDYGYHSKYLVASKTANPETAVVLDFKHPFSKVIVNITNELGADAVASVTLNGVVLQGAMDLAAGTINIEGIEAGNVTATKIADNSYAAIIMPQSAKPTLVVRTELGSTYTFVLANNFNFEAGKVATAAITLVGGGSGEGGRTEAAFSFSVTDWAAAAENPGFSAGEVTLGDYWQIFGCVYSDEDTENDVPTVEAWEKKYNMTYLGEGRWTITINYDPAMTDDASGKGLLFVKGDTYAGMYTGTESMDEFAAGYNLKTVESERKNIFLTASGNYTFTLDVTNSYNLTFTKN